MIEEKGSRSERRTSWPTRDFIYSRLETLELGDALTITAVEAVFLGAHIIKNLYGATPEVLQTRLKADSAMTPVTVADLMSEEAIKSIITTRFPNHRFNGEETSEVRGVENIDWFVDPLDGTTRFSREERDSVVGVAIYVDGKPFATSSLNPFDDELFVAKKGKGAYRLNLASESSNPIKLQVSKNGLQSTPMLYSDSLFNQKTTDSRLKFLRKFYEASGMNMNVSMIGSNINQQCQVAAGRGDATLTDTVGGFFDIAVGGLMIQEAGGIFTDLYGNPVHEATQVALGSNGLFHEQLLDIAQECYNEYRGFK